MDVVLLFPGQGSQKPGMARDLAAASSAAKHVFELVDRALGSELSRLAFEGPEEPLTQTQNAQPALLAHGAAAWAMVREHIGPHVRAAAGHSLGEFTAYYAAGAIGLAAAATLVRRRGELMFDSGCKRPGAMAAILGLEEAKVEEACRRASSDGGCVVPANYNTPEQLVISGEVAAVERAMEIAKELGARRAMRLKVSGAFHSPLMDVAREGLQQALDDVEMVAPAFPVFSNVSAGPVTEMSDARRLLLEQLTSPVRWTALLRALATAYPDALYVEMGPGNVLTNLTKRVTPQLKTATCGTAPEVEQILTMVA
ncbi:MAG: ACP S-malonyltransferase [Gemmatimonadaceae bacterium]